MDKRFFIPRHYLMAELSHDLKHEVTGGGHAFREVNPPWKRGDVEVHLPAEAEYGRKPTFRSYKSEQKLGVKLPHLIFNRDKERPTNG